MMGHYLSLRAFCRAGLSYLACLFLAIFLLPVGTASAQSISYVRVIHASPFVGTADVFVDGKKVLSSFQFAAVTGYVPIPAGVHRVQIALVGKGVNAAVITQDLPVTGGKTFTIAALGAKPNALSLQAFEDDNQVTPNQAKVRIYHLSPDAGDMNVTIGSIGALNNMSYPDASQYLSTSAGPCIVSFNDQQHNKILSLTTMLKANTVTSVFDVGLFSGNPKVQLVEAQVPAIPGMPGTGSDPYLLDQISIPAFLPWLPVAVILVLASYVLFAHRLKRTT